MEFTEDYLVPLWEKLAQEKKETILVGNFITFWIHNMLISFLSNNKYSNSNHKHFKDINW